MSPRRAHKVRKLPRKTSGPRTASRGRRVARSKANHAAPHIEWRGSPHEGYLSHIRYMGGGVLPDSYMIHPLPRGAFWVDVLFDDDPHRTSRGDRRHFVVLADGHLAPKSKRSLAQRAEFQSLDAAKRWVHQHATWRANHPGPPPEAIAAEPPPRSWWERLLWG